MFKQTPQEFRLYFEPCRYHSDHLVLVYTEAVMPQ